MTASDVVVGAAAPAVKVRLASFALNGHVRLGLGAVIYLVEAEGRFVRFLPVRAQRSERPLFIGAPKRSDGSNSSERLDHEAWG